MARCPNCKKELSPRKSWFYWTFKVDAYSCVCGTRFREYTNIHMIESPTSGNTPQIEKHSFRLVLKKGRWVKI